MLCNIESSKPLDALFDMDDAYMQAFSYTWFNGYYSNLMKQEVGSVVVLGDSLCPQLQVRLVRDHSNAPPGFRYLQVAE
eukprot:m.222595 g.222595  ORF g.222595 m.222595 type:complete len:79 (+) comp17023_c0_seq8:36-272(+)